jgi:hypothetical protein
VNYCLNVINLKVHDKYRFCAGKELAFQTDGYETSELQADGYFDAPFTYGTHASKSGLSIANVFFVIRRGDEISPELESEKFDLEMYVQKPDDWALPSLKVYVYCNQFQYERVKNLTKQQIHLSIYFSISKSEQTESKEESLSANETEWISAKFEDLVINTENLFADIEEFEIRDIKNFLVHRNCLNRGGQVTKICSEFAHSFRSVSKDVDRSDLISDINQLIYDYRYIFHRNLGENESNYIKMLNERYGFIFEPEVEEFEKNLETIESQRDKIRTIEIFNTLWVSREASRMFTDGYPISVDDAISLANSYLALKSVRSESIEKILVDVLIAATIGDKALTLEVNKQISVGTLRSLALGFYKKENNSVFYGVENESWLKLGSVVLLYSLILLAMRIALGLFEWWLTGLIAGDNETAHIILFGLLFLSNSALLHAKQREIGWGTMSAVSPRLDEKNFHILHDLCRLHSMSPSFKSSSFRSLLNKVVNEGTRFPSELHSIVG